MNEYIVWINLALEVIKMITGQMGKKGLTAAASRKGRVLISTELRKLAHMVESDA